MKTLRWNGEYWYVDQRSPWRRIRRWCIWVGGWERANGAGWCLRIPSATGGHLWMSPTPISLAGHRVTIHRHWFQVRIASGHLVVDLRERHAYISRDGTPNNAHHWLWGVSAANWHIAADARRALVPPEGRNG